MIASCDLSPIAFGCSTLSVCLRHRLGRVQIRQQKPRLRYVRRRSSSVVEHSPCKRECVGSSPTSGFSMGRVIVAILVAAALASGCSEDDPASRSAGAVEVPDLVGTTNRPAQETLSKLRLRWRYGRSGIVYASPPPKNVWSTADDDYVIEQSVTPGARVHLRTVIALQTSCSLEPLPPGAICID
jgi:hypothetical protein